jgi:transcription antitermination factor NusG
MTKPEAPPWYILRVRSQFERWAVAKLKDAKIIAYAPMETVRLVKTYASFRRGVKAKPSFVTRPILPGYVFVELLDDRSIRKVLDLDHVLEVMSVGERPVVIPMVPLRRSEEREGLSQKFVHPIEGWATMVGLLAFAEACHVFDESYRPPVTLKRGRRYTRRFAPGEKARIATGPFKGWMADVVRSRTKSRVDVILSLAGIGKVMTVEEVDLVDPDETPQPQDIAA